MDLPIPDGVNLESDVAPASWIVERLWSWGTDEFLVGSVVPEGFEAYARVLHPAYRVEGDVGTTRWSVLAERSGVPLRPETGFAEASGLDPRDTKAWDEGVPSAGSLPRDQCQALATELQRFTATPDRCWFCIWEGYGFWWSSAHTTLSSPEAGPSEVERARREAKELDEVLGGTERVQTQDRAYFLFRGPLSAASSFEPSGWYQSPNLWWPEDRAWCVASEIDLYSTYVGGSRACIDQVLAAPGPEALEVSLDARADPGP